MNLKNKKLISFVILSAFVFSYEIYSAVPDTIVVTEGESSFNQGENKLKLLGFIPYKTVNVNVIPDLKLIPSGETIGVKINVDGLLVLGLADIKTTEGARKCPAANTGITAGDLIKTINGEKITSVTDMEQAVNKSDICHIVFERQGEQKNTSITPTICSEDGRKKLGIWVRGGASGIGTMTYVNPADLSFGALGHPITDADTGDIIKSNGGDLYKADVLGVTRSERGLPGEIRGAIVESHDTGDVKLNCNSGIYGAVFDVPSNSAVEIATKDKVKVGGAYILSDVAGGGPEKYGIEILHVSKNSSDKGIVLKVTDRALLDLTGGIVQGM